MVVLPAPDGEDSTSIRPRRAILIDAPEPETALFLLDILGLFAQPVDHQLEVEPDGGQSRIEGLGAKRIGFAVEFLRQEIELAADAAGVAAQQSPRSEERLVGKECVSKC